MSSSSEYRSLDLNPNDYRNQKVDKFPEFSRPHVVGYFGIDGDRQYDPTLNQLKYLKLPSNLDNLHYDLNRGYENVIHKPESCITDEKINHILQHILQNKRKYCIEYKSSEWHRMYNEQGLRNPFNPWRLLKYDIISFRGLLRTIMCTPYEEKKDWCILATKYRGTIYLCQYETEKKKFDRLNQSKTTKRILSYGFKFEQYILKSDPTTSSGDDIDINKPVNESEEFACVFKTNLGNRKLLYVAEIDGIESNTKIDTDSEVDLNTYNLVEAKVRYRENTYANSQNYRKNKLRDWWCQNFLVGINKVHVGLRNHNGIVKKIEVIENLNKKIKDASAFWSPAVCMHFLEKFFDRVNHDNHWRNCPYTVVEYYWDPEIHDFINYRIHKGRNKYTFLPDWYIDATRIM